MDCLYGGLEVIAAVGRQLFGAVQQLGGTLPHPLRETFLIRSIGLRKIPLVFFSVLQKFWSSLPSEPSLKSHSIIEQRITWMRCISG